MGKQKPLMLCMNNIKTIWKYTCVESVKIYWNISFNSIFSELIALSSVHCYQRQLTSKVEIFHVFNHFMQEDLIYKLKLFILPVKKVRVPRNSSTYSALSVFRIVPRVIRCTKHCSLSFMLAWQQVFYKMLDFINIPLCFSVYHWIDGAF